MKLMRILHVFPDDKFFDSVSDFFDALAGVDNLYYFYISDENYSFKYIKQINNIKVFHDKKEYLKNFSNPNIDIIYFHSLPSDKYYLFKHIDSKKKVIWWCWGYDIYIGQRYLNAIVDIEIYKPVTSKYIALVRQKLTLRSLIRSVYWLIIYLYDKNKRDKVMRRIDYFSPVLPIEYGLMQKIQGFRAKSFMLKCGPGLPPKSIIFRAQNSLQNILIGNSLTFTNNHLDIFDKIRSFDIGSRKCLLPINYGEDYDRQTFKNLSGLSEKSVIWLENFIPRDQYNQLLSNVSHAIFGHIRQQALGNIFTCIRNGVKIFLYKDSIAYKSLKNDGYIVYTIDEDLTQDALQTLLSEDDAQTNFLLLQDKFKDLISRTEKELKEIMENH